MVTSMRHMPPLTHLPSPLYPVASKAEAGDELTSMLHETVLLGGASWGALLARETSAPFALICASALPPDVRAALDDRKILDALEAHLLTNDHDSRPAARFLPIELAPYDVWTAGLSPQGVLEGALVVGYEAETPVDEQRHSLLASLAKGIGLWRHSTRLQQRITRLTTQLAAINRLGQRVTSNLDRQHLFQQITHLICDSLGYDHTQLLLIDHQSETVQLVHASGTAGEQLLRQGFSEQVGGKGIIGWVAGAGRSVVCNNVAHEPRFQFHDLLPRTVAEVALPLHVGEHMIGVLDVQSERVDAFDADDIFLLQTLADQIAPALEYGRLFAAEYRERELARTLHDVSRIVCSSLELEQVLDLILQQLDRVVRHQGTSITLRSEGNTMRVVAAKGYPNNQETKQAAFEIDAAPLAPLIMYEQQTIIVTDTHSDPRWIWLPGANQVCSWIGTPLVIKDRCIGFLCIDWDQPGFYTDEHARIVRAFADQAVVAIENAQLYAAVKDFSEQLEDKVQQRTAELRFATDEIAAQAAQLRALMHRVVRVQETERQRIAHDLHDSVTQAILGAIYELQALKRRVGSVLDEPGRRLDSCQRLLNSTLLEMKEIIYALRPRALDELGLVAALENFATATESHYGVAMRFHVVGTVYRLPDDLELATYRIVQEATQNSMRHARARTINITVEFRPQRLRVTVCDDGCGFEPDRAIKGLGLAGMRERAQAFGGGLFVRSSAGMGALVTLELPRSGQEVGTDS